MSEIPQLDKTLKEELIDLSQPVTIELSGLEDLYLATCFYVFGKPLDHLPLVAGCVKKIESWFRIESVEKELRKNIRNEYFELRRKCGVSLLALGLECAEEIGILLSDDSSSVRSFLCHYLLDYPVLSLRDQLMELGLQDRDNYVRAQAIRSLVHFRCDEVVQCRKRALSDDVKDQDSMAPSPRETAIKILEHWKIKWE